MGAIPTRPLVSPSQQPDLESFMDACMNHWKGVPPPSPKEQPSRAPYKLTYAPLWPDKLTGRIITLEDK